MFGDLCFKNKDGLLSFLQISETYFFNVDKSYFLWLSVKSWQFLHMSWKILRGPWRGMDHMIITNMSFDSWMVCRRILYIDLLHESQENQAWWFQIRRSWWTKCIWNNSFTEKHLTFSHSDVSCSVNVLKLCSINDILVELAYKQIDSSWVMSLGVNTVSINH